MQRADAGQQPQPRERRARPAFAPTSRASRPRGRRARAIRRARQHRSTAGVGFDHSQGALIQTGSRLDVAVEGPGWIAVQAKDGTEAYTRSRRASNVNALGQLITDRASSCSATTARWPCRRTRACRIAKDGTVSVVPEGQGPETLAQVEPHQARESGRRARSRSGRTASSAARRASRWRPTRRFSSRRARSRRATSTRPARWST